MHNTHQENSFRVLFSDLSQSINQRLIDRSINQQSYEHYSQIIFLSVNTNMAKARNFNFRSNNTRSERSDVCADSILLLYCTDTFRQKLPGHLQTTHLHTEYKSVRASLPSTFHDPLQNFNTAVNSGVVQLWDEM
jgi:hypothetical protein